MENLFFFSIIIIVIFLILYIDYDSLIKNTSNNNNNENFDIYKNTDNIQQCNSDLLTLNPYERCNILGVKKFMIRDLRTKLWLISGQEEGFNKFLPGRFGIPLIMSTKPNEYLPLRTVADPNDYLLATYNGDGIRTVSNPYAKYFILEVYIYKGVNVIGYITEDEETKYLYIDSDGHISSTLEPSAASVIEIVEI